MDRLEQRQKYEIKRMNDHTGLGSSPEGVRDCCWVFFPYPAHKG
jgi:hypothetical protein